MKVTSIYKRVVFLILLALNLPLKEKVSKPDLKKLNSDAIRMAKKGRYNTAEKKFKYATQLDKISSIAYYNKGYTYQLQGDYNKALKNYRESLERDSGLISAKENIAEIFYEQGEYKQAIDLAEEVLKISPYRPKIHRWLPDAYKIYMEQRFVNSYDESYLSSGGTIDPFALLRSKGWYSLHFSYSVGNTVLIPRSGHKVNYFISPLALRLPMIFDFRLKSLIEVYFRVESPYVTGILHPQMVELESITEVGYRHKKYFFGAGLMYTQFLFATGIPEEGSFILNTGITGTNDFKLGLVFNYQGKKFDFNGRLYPLYLFRDSSSSASSDIAVDRNFISFETNLKPESQTRWSRTYTIIFKVDEWFISEYQTPNNQAVVGHYLGYADIGFGLAFPYFGKGIVRFPMSIGFRLTGRLYFLDLNNTDPFALFNGQGILGVDTSTSISGDVFSGFRTSSLRLLFFTSQELFRSVSFSESLLLEYTAASTNRTYGIEIFFKASLRL